MQIVQQMWARFNSIVESILDAMEKAWTTLGSRKT